MLFRSVARDAKALEDEIKAFGYKSDELNLNRIKTSLEDVFIHLLNIFDNGRIG